MYFVKRIIVNLGSSYGSSQIVAHTNKTISVAKTLLEETVKNYVREEKGRDALEQCKILDIHDLTQVSEPLVDGILLYRLENDPHRILVYQRKSSVVPSKSWMWATIEAIVPTFCLTNIFELEEYASLKLNETSVMNTESKGFQSLSNNSELETIHLNVNPDGSTGDKVTIAIPLGSIPKGNLLDDLKKYKKFQDLKKKANEAVPLSCEQFKEQDIKLESVLVI